MNIRLISIAVTAVATLALAVPIASAYEGGSAGGGNGFATDAQCADFIDRANLDVSQSLLPGAFERGASGDWGGWQNLTGGIKQTLQVALDMGCFVIIEEGDYDPDGDTDGSSTCEDPDGSDDDGDDGDDEGTGDAGQCQDPDDGGADGDSGGDTTPGSCNRPGLGNCAEGGPDPSL